MTAAQLWNAIDATCSGYSAVLLVLKPDTRAPLIHLLTVEERGSDDAEEASARRSR